MPGDPGEVQAQLVRRNRCTVRPIYSAWRAAFIRSDNGPEFVAKADRIWINAVGSKTAYIVPDPPSENGYCESFDACFRDELLNGEIFYILKEAQIIIEEWRKHYNTKRPHSALEYRPPVPETIVSIYQNPDLAEAHNRAVPECRGVLFM